MNTLTIEGIKVAPSMEALSVGEGFIVRLDVSWNLDREFRDVVRQAQSEGLIGNRLNSHEVTYDDDLYYYHSCNCIIRSSSLLCIFKRSTESKWRRRVRRSKQQSK